MFATKNEPMESSNIRVAECPAITEASGASRQSTGPCSRPDSKFFVVDPIFLAAATVRPYVRTRRDPLYRPLRIYTLDPTASRFDGAIATVNVPFEPLEPGPQGRLLEVLDREALDWYEDEDGGVANQPVKLDDPRVLIYNGRAPSVTDRKFHQQMVYAVCTSIYDVFREALGRDPSWGFAPRTCEASQCFASVRTPSTTKTPSMTPARASSISVTSMPRRLRVPTCRMAGCSPVCRTTSSHTR